MMIKIGQKSLEILHGNIIEQVDLHAIVNAANAELRRGGGVAGAIHQAAGPELEKACLPFAPIKPGQAVITEAFNLPNQYVIHCLGPIYGVNKPEDVLLANCYKNALLLADQHHIESIGFPAISTGIFGYPIELATEVTLQSVYSTLPSLTSLKLIRFVLFSEKDFEVYAKKLSQLKQHN
jgi:O-acetyl-ADP-ribose deacetylase (regulator of RNase III)